MKKAITTSGGVVQRAFIKTGERDSRGVAEEKECLIIINYGKVLDPQTFSWPKDSKPLHHALSGEKGNIMGY